jgi:Uma2 family endonuclease
MAVDVLRRRFTVEQYHQMAEHGILSPEDRVELLDGEIVEMSPIGPRHVHAVNRANRAFSRRVGDRAIVSVQNPVRLSDRSEPEPDLALLRPYVGGPTSRGLPGPGDVLLLIEVADTSAAYDRLHKLPQYARAGIPETWLLNLSGAGSPGGRDTDGAEGEPVLEAHRRPTPHGYSEIRLLRRGERIAPIALPEVEFPVDELLDEFREEPS